MIKINQVLTNDPNYENDINLMIKLYKFTKYFNLIILILFIICILWMI